MRLPSLLNKALLLLTLPCLARTGLALDTAKADHALQFARQQLAGTASRISATSYPSAAQANGTWKLVSNTDETQWVQGFFPGALWYSYQDTRDPVWMSRASTWTQNLEVQRCNMKTHDLGFKLFNSFGNGYRLTQGSNYKSVLLTAAGALASRYHPKAGVISTGDWNPAWHLPTVVDTMMNLELLFWASQNGGQRGWYDMALNHALKAAADLVRPDGSTFQVVDYDPVSGAILSRGTYQGASANSTWARGQAWALYGFTMAYRYTRDSRMLDNARKVADYYVGRLPADGVPNWDFDSTTLRKDSSTAAAAASGLIELSTLVTDSTAQARYRNAAFRSLDTLASSAYLAEGSTSQGVLLHGVGDLLHGVDVDVSLIYGDYYFIEGLIRYKGLSPPPPPPWYSALSFSEGTHGLGTGNTGVQITESDVTPLAKPIDSVIGYADSSTAITAYSSMAMNIRMNPSGYWDVRDGSSYRALASLPYNVNTGYHVRMQTDLNNKRYSVWITPSGGAEVLVASNFAFRADAPLTDDLGKVCLKSGYNNNEFGMEHHTVRSAAAIAPPGVGGAGVSPQPGAR